jgi:hypothetical protein
MTLYLKALTGFAKAYYFIEQRVEDILLSFAFNTTELKKVSEKAMLSNLERLVSNINKCQYYFELEACKALYEITLKIPFPEYYSYYNSIVTAAISRKEQSIINNHSK